VRAPVNDDRELPYPFACQRRMLRSVMFPARVMNDNQ